MPRITRSQQRSRDHGTKFIANNERTSSRDDVLNKYTPPSKRANRNDRREAT